jgi:glycosyltransferase involved in cell wall biosynthesis
MTETPGSSGRPKVIIAAPNHWTSVLQVGTHHIARAFVAEGWDVAYLSDPISPFHVAAIRRVEARQRFRTYLRGGLSDLDGRLWAYVPGTILSPRGPRVPGLTSVARRWPHWTLPRLRQKLVSAGFGTPDLTWIDSVIWEPILDLVPAKRSVLRIADRASGFTRHRSEFDAMEQRLAQRADLVVYAAASLESYVRSLRPRSMAHMPNGVDLARFLSRRARPAEYAHIPTPRAVYVGAIDDWFDFQLLAHLAASMPSVSFVIVGPDRLARRKLPQRDNVYLLGPIAPARVPAFLQHAQVGLIPFDVDGHAELVSAIHPLKLYEYVAAGLPVVAAQWPELEAMGSPAAVYRTRDEAVAVLRSALAGPTPDGAAWVANADWRGRVGRVISIVAQDAGERSRESTEP